MESIPRRHLLRGALAGCCCAGIGLRPAHAKSLSDIGGCALIGTDAGLMDTSRLSAPGDPSLAGQRTTGQKEMDTALDAALKRIADVFGVFPGFAFFDDTKSPNAYALDRVVISGRNGTVAFGRKLFSQLLSRDPSGIAVIMVAAHEFGHIKQYTSGKYRVIQGGQPTNKRIELHADFLAGYYMGLRKTAHPEASFWKAGQEIWNIGDYAFNNKSHHGTPEERSASAEAGFALSYLQGRDFAYAFDAGLAYVADK